MPFMDGIGDSGMSAEPWLIEVRKNVLKQNDSVAHALRERFRAAGVYVVSFVSGPGTGKTTLLERTLAMLQPQFRVAKIRSGFRLWISRISIPCPDFLLFRIGGENENNS
jgi:hypothetical protein